MKKYIEKLPHSCGTSDALQVFAKPDGTVDGFCYACGTYVKHPYGEEKEARDFPAPKQKTPEEIQEEIAWVGTFPQVQVNAKYLHGSAIREFDVRVGMSEEDGKTPTTLFYPFTRGSEEVIGWKCKIFAQKKIWSIGDMKNVDFFGWQQAIKTGAKRLYITEGEDDALSVWRCFRHHDKPEWHTFNAVVSLPNGVASAKQIITDKWDELSTYFQEIVLCFDTDDKGKAAMADICTAFPTILQVTVPSKDANQAIAEGKSEALYTALRKPVRPKNTRLIDIGDIIEDILTPPKWGELSWPWPKLDDCLRGVRYGETIYIGAGVKMGKSELVNALGAHFVKEHDVNILMAKPEEANSLTGKKLAGKWQGEIYHDPKVQYNEARLAEAVEKMTGKVKLIDLYQHLGWETLQTDIVESVINNGSKAVFIDPITNLVDDLNAAEANTKLQIIARECSAMAKDLNIVIFLFCHLKAHEGHLPMERREAYYAKDKYISLGNCAHEHGGTVYSNQFRGSRAMMQKCDLMLGLEGNHDPEMPDKRWENVKHLKILENRAFGDRGVFPLYWNPLTQLFTEIDNALET